LGWSYADDGSFLVVNSIHGKRVPHPDPDGWWGWHDIVADEKWGWHDIVADE
jgi:hypothetical protein